MFEGAKEEDEEEEGEDEDEEELDCKLSKFIAALSIEENLAKDN